MLRCALRAVPSLCLAGGLAALSAELAPVHAQFVEPDVSVVYTLHAEAAGNQFGFVGAVIGDLNGDGASEILIGAPRNAAGGNLAGRAYVYSGRDGALLNTITGGPFQRLGFGVAGVGDINGDGVPDYAVSGPGTPGGPVPQIGRLLVLSGSDHTVIFDIRRGGHLSFFGYDINAAGDVNGDGTPDIIAGAPFSSVTGQFTGRVHLISGRDGSALWTQDGQAIQTQLGSAVSGVGDLDGDGLVDVAVGGRGSGPKNAGEAFVLRGTTGAYLRTLKPAATAVDFGNFFVHNAGDVDRDGVLDILVADFADDRLGPNTGRAYVFSGANQDKLRVFNGENAGDGFGIGRACGDLNGDGAADFILAGYTSSAGAPTGGKVYLYSGKTGMTLRTMTGNVSGATLGFDALPVGDINGDGAIDFLITGSDIAHVVAGKP
ncbi:MAG TPA: FG-GAP-like repeat-containing protein [Candidatus Polarisedimenticolia bacterium]|nr:FG-GAP-like repeat-containing protein [Candidatus Polarisedimenticolia bacterium]